ncbi:hypothetical protein BaRGS_00023112 [Batillaria attramentaria]|uniref:Uncharacterized protein n=1 Tax=Batillaria attramentaria TaxID=370345 RepID=A0ABD0JIW4_9CAEN
MVCGEQRHFNATVRPDVRVHGPRYNTHRQETDCVHRCCTNHVRWNGGKLHVGCSKEIVPCKQLSQFQSQDWNKNVGSAIVQDSVIQGVFLEVAQQYG